MVSTESTNCPGYGEPVILIIEDDSQMTRKIIESLGDQYNLLTSSGGEDGLRQALMSNPALIITDLVMLKNRDRQMVEEIRKQPALRNVPILIVSTSADEELKSQLIDEGVQDFILQPFTEAIFRVRVKNLILLHQGLIAREMVENSNRDLQQFCSIIESSDDAIISKNLNGIIASWNQGAERIFGYKADEVIGKHIGILIPQDRQDEEPAIISRIVAGERVDHFDTVRQRKDGTRVDISLTVSPIKDLRGQIIGASKIARDVTARKKNEEELKKFTIELERRVAERTYLLEEQAERLRELAVELTGVEQKERRRLAEVLHDHVQQYLVAAKMRLELIVRKSATADKAGLQDASSYIDKASDASRQLTAELRPPVLYEGGLNAGLRYLKQKMEEQYRIKVHLSVSGHIEPGSDLVKIMIYQCVQELLFNAVKYARVSEYFVTLLRLENTIKVTVEDQGLGFNVANAGSKDKGGFGLFSIRERMKAIGGELHILSTIGKGSVFSIIVPDKVVEMHVRENLGLPRDKIAMRTRSEKEGIIILVADDHPIIRQSIASLLMAQPFIKKVIEASNGQEAIEQADVIDPDIILMDINMPIVNGIEATQYLSHSNPRCKIIGLSVQAKSDVSQAMKDAGAVAYFNKGDDTNSLIDAIKELAYQYFLFPVEPLPNLN